MLRRQPDIRGWASYGTEELRAATGKLAEEHRPVAQMRVFDRRSDEAIARALEKLLREQ